MMATGGTAPPLALPSSPLPLLDDSPSNLSSPLSDVEDKDANPDEMDLDMQDNGSGRPGTPKRHRGDAGEDSDTDPASDEESKLSEMDINDSEAETERLYDTPLKNGAVRDVLGDTGEAGGRQFVDRRGRVFERSPSKLQQQLQAEIDAENAPSDNDSLSDAEDEEDDDASVASSEPEPELEHEKATGKRLRSPIQAKKTQEAISATDSTASQPTRQDSQDSRKRKRSSIAEQSEAEQPLRKRTGSIGVREGDFSADDAAVADDEGGISTNPQSGSHTGEEDNDESTAPVAQDKEKPLASVEDEAMELGRSKRSKRTATKKRKSKSLEDSGGQAMEEAQDDPPDDVDEPATEDAVPHAEDEHAEDVDEVEAAHKNEEECKRLTIPMPSSYRLTMWTQWRGRKLHGKNSRRSKSSLVTSVSGKHHHNARDSKRGDTDPGTVSTKNAWINSTRRRPCLHVITQHTPSILRC